LEGRRLWFADVDFETGAIVTTEQDELGSFYGGLLGQGGAMKEGAAYTESWAAVQRRYGVLRRATTMMQRSPRK
jgi:mannosyl-oligosaccharide alpha-1,2-mannosidase